MWAHYGENHKGICLILDKKLLDIEFSKINKIACESFNVDYLDFLEFKSTETNRGIAKMLASDNLSLYEHCNENKIYDRFKKKNYCWKSEQEFRWLLFMNNSEDTLISCRKALKAIILGANFDYVNQSDKLPKDVPIFSNEYDYGKYYLSSWS